MNSAASTSSECSTDSRVKSHLKELDNEIAEMGCLKQKLIDILDILKLNSALNSEIIDVRTKQLVDVEKSLKMLSQESNFIKNNMPKPASSGGITYPDGTRARSCKEYRYPSGNYQYNGEGSGLYDIEPSKGLVMTVYCDMVTEGGGWTLISGIRSNYEGIHFHTFEDSTAVATSNITSFHIKTSDLLASATQIRAATDTSKSEMTSFYQSEWPFSASCSLNNNLRKAILNPNTNNGDLSADCVVISGLKVVPKYFTYGKTCNAHSIGFRMGQPRAGCSGHMGASSYATFSFNRAPEGNIGNHLGVHYSFGGEESRNGVIFLR